MERGDGAAELRVGLRAGQTRLLHLYQHDPGRILFPLPGPGQPMEAVLLVTCGGLTGGDRLRIGVDIEAGAALSVAGQAAEKLYRSSDADCRIDAALAVAPAATLEYVPQETILFEGARLARRQVVDLAPDARVIAADMLVFGRSAHGGERFTNGSLRDSWRVRRSGRLVWADSLRLDGDIVAALDNPFAFAGARALATAFCAVPDPASLLELARERLVAAACKAGVTLVNGLLVMRCFGPDTAVVRATLVDYLSFLRHAAFGWPAQLPRVWHT